MWNSTRNGRLGSRQSANKSSSHEVGEFTSAAPQISAVPSQHPSEALANRKDQLKREEPEKEFFDPSFSFPKPRLPDYVYESHRFPHSLYESRPRANIPTSVIYLSRPAKPTRLLIQLSGKNRKHDFRDSDNGAIRIAAGDSQGQGRPFTESMGCTIIFANSVEEIMASYLYPDRIKLPRKVLDFVPAKNIKDYKNGNGHVFDNRIIAEVIRKAFNIKEFHFTQLIRSSTIKKDETPKHIRTLPILKYVELPSLDSDENLTCKYVKQVVAHPRYKYGMKIYITPGKLDRHKWIYACDELLEQEQSLIVQGELPIPSKVELYGLSPELTSMILYAHKRKDFNHLVQETNGSSESSSNSNSSQSTEHSETNTPQTVQDVLLSNSNNNARDTRASAKSPVERLGLNFLLN